LSAYLPLLVTERLGVASVKKVAWSRSSPFLSNRRRRGLRSGFDSPLSAFRFAEAISSHIS
jgi:hypothetical protein